MVMVKLKDPTDENIETAVARIKEMDGKIDVIRSFSVGKDIIRSERSYDIGLVTTFDSMADLEIYNTHPVHVPVLQYLKTIISGVVAVDFES